MLPPGTLYGRKMKVCYMASGKHISHCWTKTGRFFFLNCNSQINVEQMEQQQKLWGNRKTELLKEKPMKKKQERNRKQMSSHRVQSMHQFHFNCVGTIYTSFSPLWRLNYCWSQSRPNSISVKRTFYCSVQQQFESKTEKLTLEVVPQSQGHWRVVGAARKNLVLRQERVTCCILRWTAAFFLL